jgi:glycerol uptake facilitator-like aquaporin
MFPRLLSALIQAAGGFLRTAWRLGRQVFHEVTGALFVVFAAAGAASAWRQWQKGEAQWLVALAIAFALMMAAFAVASFRSARRVH